MDTEIEEVEGDGADPVLFLDSQAPSSLIEQIRSEVEELSQVHEVYIPVMGYDQSRLQVKYRMPESGKELEMITAKATRETKDRFTRNLFIAMDTMIRLCVGLYVQPEDIEEPVELDPDDVGTPVGFDARLAEIIGMNGGGGSARTVVRKLFGNNDLALLNHAEKLSRWLANNKADLDREVWELGE